MSSACYPIECPRCGCPSAMKDTDVWRYAITMCFQCGFFESWELENPLGAFGYRSSGKRAERVDERLYTVKDVESAPSRLLNLIEIGVADPQSMYLTCWNVETNQVEFIVGDSSRLPYRPAEEVEL